MSFSTFDEFGIESDLSSQDLWRLCDELTVVQAALLLAGYDPSELQSYVEQYDPNNRPDGYEAAKAAISRALIRGSLEGQLVPIYETDINGNTVGEIPDSIDLENSVILVDSLRTWLRDRGISTGFFFPTTDDKPDFLNTENPRYSPKLAAAVSAWYAIDDEEALAGKSAKQALEKWLREHAARFGLSDDDGTPNEKGIQECAKVANWQVKGGAPRTPDRNPDTLYPPD